MIRISPKEVMLNPNEEWISERFDLHLDEGMGIDLAARTAFLDFWYAFPGSEEDPLGTPFRPAFAMYLADGRRTWNRTAGAILRYCQMHTNWLHVVRFMTGQTGQSTDQWEAYDDAH